MAEARPERAALFIDGNNWYHSLREAGVGGRRRLSYSRVSRKLVGRRQWIETRYYIGALKQAWNPAAYAAQRAFLSRLPRDDARITVHLGRLERRVHENPLAAALLAALDDSRVQIPAPAREHLASLAMSYRRVETLKEKAVEGLCRLARLLVTAPAGRYQFHQARPSLVRRLLQVRAAPSRLRGALWGHSSRSVGGFRVGGV